MRRHFGIPHPRFIWEQGLFFEQHWGDILKVFARSSGSLSTPISDPIRRRAISITAHSALPKLRLRAFSKFKYCLITDVSRCYPSIYTHSIPWAIHGRENAKKDRKVESPTIFGNRLDFLIRQAQDGQTIGIPVGPDVSRMIGEIVLSAVDTEFIALSTPHAPVYLRHIDDYWVGGESADECERHLINLRSALRRYELDINDLKTRVVSVSELLGDFWPADIERELERGLRVSATRQQDLVTILSMILDRSRRHADDGMIRFSIKKIDSLMRWDKHWDVLEHFLAQCAVQFPHSFDYVARVIAWRKRIDLPIDEELWSDVTSKVVANNSAFGHDSEVYWALWLMRELGITLTSSASQSICRRNGPIVLGYLAHMHARNLALGRGLPTELRSSIEGDYCAGSYWPLSLELVHLDLWPRAWKLDSCKEVFRPLHDKKVSLVEWDASPPVFVVGDGDDDDGGPPKRAIEDFGDAYDEEDDEADGEDDDENYEDDDDEDQYPF